MNATTNEYAREILEKAAELIGRGWCQDAVARNRIGLGLTCPRDAAACTWCITGALDFAVQEVRRGQDPVDWSGTLSASDSVTILLARRVSAPALACKFGNAEGCLIVWNDAPGRTQKQVVGLLNAVKKEFLAD